MKKLEIKFAERLEEQTRALKKEMRAEMTFLEDKLRAEITLVEEVISSEVERESAPWRVVRKIFQATSSWMLVQTLRAPWRRARALCAPRRRSLCAPGARACTTVTRSASARTGGGTISSYARRRKKCRVPRHRSKRSRPTRKNSDGNWVDSSPYGALKVVRVKGGDLCLATIHINIACVCIDAIPASVIVSL